MTISQQIAKRWAICEENRPEPDMNREVEFLFDYGSPFSYLANLQIEGFAKRNGAAVTYTPILLAAVLKATGNASPMTIPAKGRYMATELRRWAARYGVAFKPNPHGFMSNTLRLMRGAVAAQQTDGSLFTTVRSIGPHGPKRRTWATIRYCKNCWKTSVSRRLG
jgi:2-hydroxychromene-2-carboxylate isomerase